MKQHRQPTAWVDAAVGLLVTATIFGNGDLNERSGAFHLLAVFWILAAAVRVIVPLLGKQDAGLRFFRCDIPAYLFFVWVAVSITWNLLPGNGGAPRPGLNMLSVWLALGAAWFLFRQTLERPETRNAALRLILAVVLAEAATGLHQQFVEFPQILHDFRTNPVATVAAADPSLEQGTPDWDRFVKRLETMTPMGTYPLSNSLGGLLAVGFVLMLGVYFSKPSVNSSKPVPSWRKILGGALLAVVLFCFVLTKCRSGFVAVAVGLALFGWFSFPRFNARWTKRILIGTAVAVVFVAAVSVAVPGKSMISGAKRSLGFRLEYWQASTAMIADHPLFGCGSGNFKQAYTKYKLPWASEEIADPHNFAVELAAVAGLPALALFVTAVVGLMFRLGFSRCTAKTQAASPADANTKLFYWSGLGGGVLAFVVSLYAESQIAFEPILFLLVAFPLVDLAFGDRREIPPWVPAIGLVVFLVHLSAAGGISATNSAILVWLLAAILLNETAPTDGTENKKVCGMFLCVFVGSLLAVNHFGLQPMLRSLPFLLDADEARDVPRRIESLRKAAAVDPWSATIQERLSTEAFRGWFAHPNDKAWKATTCESLEKSLELSPRSAGLRFMYAERLFAMYEKTGDVAVRDRALELYREAIDRYPNHAKIRGPYAVALWKSGQKEESLRQRDEALRLDDIMPHDDQKLADELRKRLVEFYY